MAIALRILLLEDALYDAELAIAVLEEAGYACQWDRVQTRAEFLTCLAEHGPEYDLILADHSLPSFDGLTALKLFLDHHLDLPFIIVSGTLGEEIAVESLKAGATDYVLKNRLSRLGPVVARALREKEAQRRRRQAEAALRASEEKFRAIFNESLDVIMVIDAESGQIQSVNRAVHSILGYEEATILGQHFSVIFPPAPDLSKEELIEQFRIHGAVLEAQEFLRADGSICPMDVTATLIPWGEEKVILATFRDVTKRQQAEALLAGQKRMLEMIAMGIPLAEVLNALMHFVEGQAANLIASILLLNESGTALRHVAALSLPEGYTQALGVVAVGPSSGSSGTAVYRRQPVIVSDIAHDPLWKDYRDLALQYGLRACWAVPIFSTSKQILGTFALYYHEPRTPTPQDLQLIEVASHIAGIAIERQQAENAIRESEERFRATFEQAAVGIAHIAPDGRWLRVNQKLCQILGYSHQELLQKTFQDVTYPEDLETDLEYTRQMLANDIQTYSTEKRYIHQSGSLIWVNLTLSPVREPSGQAKYFIAVIEDVTERKQLEEQFLQSQKMEAVGRLAGGVAHDFNNLLTVTTGYSELLLDRFLNDSDPSRQFIEEIKKAGERATSLARQLLAFSRQQMLQPKILDLNMVVSDIDKMLQRLIGEDIDLITLLAPNLWRVKADPGQLEQVIMNLAINARDAMPSGGKLTIETANVELDQAYARRHVGVVPGYYVMLAVSDNGQGMDQETRSHIFEPFFTTKEKDKGTGLGLATVHGIVTQSGGYIWVYSEVGRGTTFKIYLPRVEEIVEVARPDQDPIVTATGSETLLLVEDDNMVRALAHQILLSSGYTILEASNGPEAIQTCEQYAGPIHLLLTDVVMPGGMSGRDLAERLVSLRPAMKVLYMSGYTDNAIVHHGVLDPDLAFLQKPFSPAALVRKVREVLDKI